MSVQKFRAGWMNLNHFMAIVSAFHFCVLFFFLACGFLFDERQRFRELLLACLAAVLCIYSLAGGFVSTLFLLVAFCCFKVMRARQAIDEERRRELLQLILVVGVVGAVLIIWTIGYVKPPYHPAIVYPYTVRFWLFFLNLVALAFGIMRISTVAGILCLLIVLTPVCGEIWKRRRDLSKLRWRHTLQCSASLRTLPQYPPDARGSAGPRSAVSRVLDTSTEQLHSHPGVQTPKRT